MAALNNFKEQTFSFKINKRKKERKNSTIALTHLELILIHSFQ